MRICLITPAPPNSRSGNRCTAARWASIFRSLGHKVDIAVDYDGSPADAMLALHAWRSAASIERFHQKYPEQPLIVSLTGTDAYRFIHTHKKTTLRSIELADHLVGLHSLIGNTVPEEFRHKVHVIYQSAQAINKRQPVKRSFRVCVAGHLRDEKDSLRPAYAVRNLPQNSRIQVHHFGKAHTPEWAEQAKQEMSNNPRYQWHGEVAHHQIRRAYSQSHVLILPSRMEGGANVISESIIAGLPVIASNIEGSIGLLGEDYPGYYPVEDELALRDVLLRAESDKQFYTELKSSCNARRELFRPETETESWKQLLSNII